MSWNMQKKIECKASMWSYLTYLYTVTNSDHHFDHSNFNNVTMYINLSKLS